MDSKSLTKTSFCGKEIDNVTNNDLKKQILHELFKKYCCLKKKSYLVLRIENLIPMSL